MRLCIVLPVYNEEVDLAKNFSIVHNFFTKNLTPQSWEIVIAEQASTDQTKNIGEDLSRRYLHTRFVHFDQKGRGGALKEAWLAASADYVGYMDIDLSSKLDCVLPLLKALDNGADIAIGSRLSKGSVVRNRTRIRSFSSWAFRLFLRSIFRIRFDDAQCGFKAVRYNVFMKIAPQIQSRGWIFDTELLVIAERAGFRVAVIPIEWTDDLKSSVRIVRYAWEGFWGGVRLFMKRPWTKITK